jgi:hypothetical protein
MAISFIHSYQNFTMFQDVEIGDFFLHGGQLHQKVAHDDGGPERANLVGRGSIFALHAACEVCVVNVSIDIYSIRKPTGLRNEQA